jgi:hypothetical protein
LKKILKETDERRQFAPLGLPRPSLFRAPFYCAFFTLSPSIYILSFYSLINNSSFSLHLHSSDRYIFVLRVSSPMVSGSFSEQCFFLTPNSFNIFIALVEPTQLCKSIYWPSCTPSDISATFTILRFIGLFIILISTHLYIDFFSSLLVCVTIYSTLSRAGAGGESVRLTSIRYVVRSPVTAHCSNPTWLGVTRKGSTG